MVQNLTELTVDDVCSSYFRWFSCWCLKVQTSTHLIRKTDELFIGPHTWVRQHPQHHTNTTTRNTLTVNRVYINFSFLSLSACLTLFLFSIIYYSCLTLCHIVFLCLSHSLETFFICFPRYLKSHLFFSACLISVCLSHPLPVSPLPPASPFYSPLFCHLSLFFTLTFLVSLSVSFFILPLCTCLTLYLSYSFLLLHALLNTLLSLSVCLSYSLPYPFCLSLSLSVLPVLSHTGLTLSCVLCCLSVSQVI